MLVSGLMSLGLNTGLAVKIVLVCLTLLGGSGTYLVARRHASALPALVAASLFVLAPYHAYNAFARNAFSEFTALCIVPWVFYGLSATLGQKSHPLGPSILAVATAVWVLAHNLSVLMYAPLLVLYAVFVYSQSRSKTGLAKACLSVVVAALMTSFYFLPALVELSYVSMQIAPHGTHAVLDSFPADQGLWSTRWRPNTLFLVSLSAVGLVTCAVGWRREGKARRWFFFTAATTVLALIPTLSISAPIWAKVRALHLFQFPWRFYSPATLFLCFMAGAGIGSLRRRQQAVIGASLILLAAIHLVTSYPPNELNILSVRSEALQQNAIKASRANTSIFDEFLPRWVVDRPAAPVDGYLIAESPDASIEPINVTSINRRYRVSSPAGTQLMALVYYFPGWTVSVDEEPVEFDLTRLGTMQFDLDADEHEVSICFESTPIRTLGVGLSALGLSALFAMILFGRARRKR